MSGTCGPIYPFGRVQNQDGTWTVGNNAQCEVPDPDPWSHTYTFSFPSTLNYPNGVTLQFVGSASAYVQGHHDRVFRAVRLVTVDSATLTDPSGNNCPLIKSEVYPSGPDYPTDQWTSTTELASDTLYTFLASGTDPEQDKASDTLVISAIYKQTAP